MHRLTSSFGGRGRASPESSPIRALGTPTRTSPQAGPTWSTASSAPGTTIRRRVAAGLHQDGRPQRPLSWSKRWSNSLKAGTPSRVRPGSHGFRPVLVRCRSPTLPPGSATAWAFPWSNRLSVSSSDPNRRRWRTVANRRATLSSFRCCVSREGPGIPRRRHGRFPADIQRARQPTQIERRRGGIPCGTSRHLPKRRMTC